MFKQVDAQDSFLEINNYFVYRKKEYGFDIDFFKRSSEYFQENFKDLQKQKHINLIKQEHEYIIMLPEDTINDFIRYCHNQKISISFDNVVALNYLAKQFKVRKLIIITDKIISENKSELALQLLSFYNEIDDTNKEDIISENFFEYINKEQIFLLQIPVLHRIIKKNLSIFEKEDQNLNKEKLIEFLFQCLSRFGRKASVLFSEIDFEKIETKYLNRLLTEFSDIFDFHFFNMTFLKKTYEIQSQSIKFLEIQKKILNDQNFLNNENDQIKTQIIQIQKVMNEFVLMKKENKQNCEQIAAIQKEIDESKKENQIINKMLNNMSSENQKLKSEVQTLKSKQNDLSSENQKLKNEVQTLKSKQNDLLNENQKFKNEIKTLDRKISELSNENQINRKEVQTLSKSSSILSNDIEKIKIDTQTINSKFVQNISYNPLKPFKGIINYLTEKSGGNVCDQGIVNVTSKDHFSDYYPKNVVDLESDSVFESQNTKDEWLCFDFGKNRITPTSYTIKTYDDTIGWTSSEAVTGEWNLKSWVIEVSIDGVYWTEIDRRQNNYDLNRPNAYKNFTVKKKIECRYFRLRQIGPNHKGYYYIVLKAFEIFGEMNFRLL